jgi:nucleoside-diphosphate-sugar epimerase
VLGYNVSKTQAEAAAWKFMEINSPSFDLTVINPDVILGPMIHPVTGPKSINESNRFGIADFINGNYKTVEDVRFLAYHFVCLSYSVHILRNTHQYQVDVRDVARAHVEALMNPAAGGKRIVLVSELFTPQLVANIIRKNFPNLRDRVSEGTPSQILPAGVHPTGWSLERSEQILDKGAPEGKWDYIGLEKSVIDAVRSMQENGVL